MEDIEQMELSIEQAFLWGLKRLKQKRYELALDYFTRACQLNRDPARANVLASYQGVTRVLFGDEEGRNLCRRAAHFECNDADVYFNLALAEIRMGDRKRALDAIRLGLMLDDRHGKLLRLRGKIGVRRKPLLTFLEREHWLNYRLGKMTWRLRQVAKRARQGELNFKPRLSKWRRKP